MNTSIRASGSTATLSAAVLAAVAACFSLPAAAQAPAASAPAHGAHSTHAADMMEGQGEGEVRKIDRAGKKLTLKHGEISGMDMPPMTMVFTVKEAALLDRFKVGDPVRFKVTRQGASLLITELEAARR
ncbi:copper-binding protein [Paucibacter sp. DJ1R-11]|uniref:copper-binding protein n=1 Tax=Paucibacter sp. DJ1R-11 TaxID=2893556 RepID=UPI0021E3943A|nr:copper-binding protein [Paucibacter sp. DJ1R-11]MCV2363291.1 copper-binding protein [Paucibacter sp. DJ1R-11]